MKISTIYKFPIGKIEISIEDNFITCLSFAEKSEKNSEKTDNILLVRAINQLNEYFSGKRKHFDLPLKPKGTEFQQRVWNALQAIPYGETRSYKDIAEAVGSAKAFRAVGMANNKNPIAIIIPCHRVIGAGGALVGYAGGLASKQMLLDLERGLAYFTPEML